MSIKDILYLGDTDLRQQAGYLAGVMSCSGISFDYLPSNLSFDEKLLKNSYKAVVLSDYPSSNFTASQLEKLAEMVKDGTGLIMIGGWESFQGLDGNYSSTPLADILPVNISDSDDRMNVSSPLLISRELPHPVISELPFDKQAPVIGGLNRVTPKPNSEVILRGVKFTASKTESSYTFTQGESYPLLITGFCGKSRTAAFTSDVAPHWAGPLIDWGDARVNAQADGAEAIEVGNYYTQFFSNILKWLTKEI
ncbi:glutamine amidotransferase [Sedimentisphaera salicampi]|uniref:Putative membrane protein n=1 Tax=Sedimentisphaera salicampi TaxID=1941349 RepID=A0A1W6LLQ6_9BACT|nr:glutamine amidotransferase [Sedimentisphaera salicampi]ARN56697.1 putative membrane protein [Sedimentisphaera salicampi]